MMEVGFLIVSYTRGNMMNVIRCYESIRSLYKNKIIIVDNSGSGKEFTIDNNLFFYNNDSNTYELGALWFAVKKHTEIDRWVIIHDSCSLNFEIPYDLYQNQNDLCMSFWSDLPQSYAPVFPNLIKNLESIGIDLHSIDFGSYNSICGLMSIIDRSLIYKMIEIGADKIKTNSKFDAVTSEIFIGFLVSYFKNEKVKSLYQKPISHYFNSNTDWGFITKYTSGLGHVSFENYIIDEKSNLHPIKIIKSNFENEEELFLLVLNGIVSSENCIKEIFDTVPPISGLNYKILNINYSIENYDIQSIYARARHEVFNYVYFRDYFDKKYLKNE